MIISFSRGVNVRDTLPKMIIDGKDVERVEHAKLLGVTLSNDLSWNKHADTIIGKAGKHVTIFRIGRHSAVYN